MTQKRLRQRFNHLIQPTSVIIILHRLTKDMSVDILERLTYDKWKICAISAQKRSAERLKKG